MTMPVAEITQLPGQSSRLFDNEAVTYERGLSEITTASLISPEDALLIRVSPALPDHILLGSLGDGRLRVQSPITVKLIKEDQHVIAEATELDEFGFGTNLSEALRDLQGAIVELYFTLEAEQDRLGPDLQRIRATLQHKLLRRS